MVQGKTLTCKVGHGLEALRVCLKPSRSPCIARIFYRDVSLLEVFISLKVHLSLLFMLFNSLTHVNSQGLRQKAHSCPCDIGPKNLLLTQTLEGYQCCQCMCHNFRNRHRKALGYQTVCLSVAIGHCSLFSLMNRHG